MQSVDQKESISKEELGEIWDAIREEPVFAEDGNEKKRGMKIVCSLLEKQGYLSTIHLYSPQTKKMFSGYQLDAGKGRRYALGG